MRQELNRAVAELHVNPLRANDALTIHDDKAHFGKLAHHPHRPFGTQMHVVLRCHFQVGVGENRKCCARALNDLRGLRARINANANDLRACLFKLIDLFLQLTELLLTRASAVAHVEREHIFFSIARLKGKWLALCVR